MHLNVRLFRRSNGYWYAEFERGKWLSLRVRDKETARRLYNRLRREFLLGKLTRLETRSIGLATYGEEYLESREGRMERSTVSKDRLSLSKLVSLVGNKPIGSIDERDLDSFVSSCLKAGVKKSSVNVYLRHLKGAFNKAVRLGYIVKSPFVGFSMVREDPRPLLFLMPRDVLKLTNLMKEAGEIELARFVWLSVLTGLRRSEIVRLEARDVRLDIGIIHVRKGKGHRERWVPISPMLALFLREADLPRVGRIFTRYQHPDTYTHEVKGFLVKAGFKDFRLHDLRHTFASLAALRGASQKDIKELLGHSDIRTSDRYTHLVQDRLREVVSDLGFDERKMIEK